MLFNSIEFLIFLPLCFLCYWFLLKRSLKGQNVFILLASYVFYGWWDYRFLALIVASSVVDYWVGLSLHKTEAPRKRKWLLSLSLLFNLGLLGFFKYYNFFVESWMDAWSSVGVEMHASTLQIILPVGISFYTFQTLSYTIDVYRKKLEPTQNLVNFAAYVAFFPQLVAGPIERAAQLLPQFSKPRSFDYTKAMSGLRLMIWGFFQKVVIADSCATYVNAIFDNYEGLNSLSLIMGVFYFAFQIYGDFAGYSNIAIGVARLLGFDLMRNFNYPYFSRDIAEFWRRWHISLTTWFRDYLYIPLGGSRGSKANQIRNVFIIFLVSGFWHGANWTFVAWGAINALYFLPLMLTNNNRKYLDIVAQDRLLPNVKELLQMGLTFILACVAWIFFRAPSLSDSLAYLKRILTDLQFNPQYLNIERYSVELVLLVGLFVLIEWFHRRWEHPLNGRWIHLKTALTLVLILIFGVYSEHQSFIYFQF